MIYLLQNKYTVWKNQKILSRFYSGQQHMIYLFLSKISCSSNGEDYGTEWEKLIFYLKEIQIENT